MKDHIGLILKGTEEDDNPYEKKNISIIRDLDFPNIGLLDIADQIGTTESEADCNIKWPIVLTSIELAIQSFIDTYGKKKWNKRVIF